MAKQKSTTAVLVVSGIFSVMASQTMNLPEEAASLLLMFGIILLVPGLSVWLIFVVFSIIRNMRSL